MAHIPGQLTHTEFLLSSLALGTILNMSGQTLPDLVVSAYLVIVMMSSLPGVSIWMPDIQWHSQS
jgi:hypothetical protein